VPEETFSITAIPQEVSILVDTHMKVWAIYVNWFTWFFGMNLLALSWIVTSPSPRKDFILPLVLVLELCIAAAIGGTAVFYLYCRRSRERVKQLLADASTQQTIDGFFVGQLADYSCAGMIVIFFGVGAMWCYVYMHF
jgi:hypothetical protein